MFGNILRDSIPWSGDIWKKVGVMDKIRGTNYVDLGMCDVD